MRVPFSKPWRAIPELDKFSDEECRAYVREAKRANLGARIFVSVFAIVVFVIVMIVLAFFIGLILSDVRFEPKELGIVVYVCVPVLGGVMSAFTVRDLWVKEIVMERLKEAKCGRCAYSLMGLAVVDSGVVCPECGERLDLATRGLTQADLMSPPAANVVETP